MNDAAHSPALARGLSPASGRDQAPRIGLTPPSGAAYFAGASFASGSFASASFDSDPSMYAADRLRLRVDLVRDVELVGDLAAAVAATPASSFGSKRFSASSGDRKRVPGRNFAYSSGGTPARAAMIFTASAWLAGSRT